MPFIMSKVNVPVDAEQETQLKSRLGKAMELLPEDFEVKGLRVEYRVAAR